jgi:hypothetical protein
MGGGTLLGVGLVLALAMLVGAFPAGDDGSLPRIPRVEPIWGRPVVATQSLPQHLGIRVTSVAVTGGGGLLDVRFQVLDPELAGALHDARTPPAVVQERTGLFIDQLLMGHAHSGPFRQAESYYLLFLNSGRWVHRGDEVSLLLGGVQVHHVKVS